MRRTIFFGVFLALIACKKEDTIFIPLHSESNNWLVNTTRFFVDGAGDTLFFTSSTTGELRYSDLIDVAENSGFWDRQLRIQTTEIDSTFTLITELGASLDSGFVRNDHLNITFRYATSQLTFSGFAHPKNIINLDSGVFFLPLWEVNGQVFNDVYYSEVRNPDHVVVFINADYNLVGFFVNGKLYSLDI